MPNPRYLFCDSDALFQTFLTKQSQLLRLLARDYGIAPVIVPEVELELFSIRKFKHLSASVNKALRDGVLVRFDAVTMSDYLGGNPNAAGPTYEAIQRSGTDYAKRVGRGEAYTFATQVTSVCRL